MTRDLYAISGETGDDRLARIRANRLTAMTVTCPWCRVAPDVPCHTAKGHTLTQPHAWRYKEAGVEPR